MSLKFVGLVSYRPTPIAVLTPRGTVRTRKAVPKGSQRYPQGSPVDWLGNGHVTAGVWCIGCRHHADLRLDALPRLPWARIGRAMLCTDCGTPGFVDIKPNWHDIERYAMSSSPGRQRK